MNGKISIKETLCLASVVVLLLLAGCSGTTATEGKANPTDSPTESKTPIPTPSATETPTQNPWQKDTIIVGINKTTNPDRTVAPRLRAALNYWEENGTRYGDFGVQYRIRKNASNPDIEVRITDELEVCGNTLDLEVRYFGCASILSANTNPDQTEVVRIISGLTDPSLERAFKHEFGHTQGIEHGQEPTKIMNETVNMAYISKPDAVDRPFPWKSYELNVYTNIQHLPEHEQAETKEQVQHALDYYSSGAEGNMPQNISFNRVDTPSRAHIVINATDANDEYNSTSETWGSDTDTDVNLEWFTYTTITIEGIEESKRGWHVGYWLGYALGAESVDDLPEPFDDPENDDWEGWWH